MVLRCIGAGCLSFLFDGLPRASYAELASVPRFLFIGIKNKKTQLEIAHIEHPTFILPR